MRLFSLLVILALTLGVVFAVNASVNGTVNMSGSTNGSPAFKAGVMSANAQMNTRLLAASAFWEDDDLDDLIEHDLPTGFGMLLLRFRSFFTRDPAVQLDMHLRFALGDLKEADAAVKAGRKEAAERALERYAKRVKQIREVLNRLSQPPEDILAKLAVYAEYEQQIRARLAEMGVEDDTPSLEDALREKGYDEANLTRLRERALEKYGASGVVLLRNEERFIARVEASYLLALRLNLSFNASLVSMHLQLAKEELDKAWMLVNTSNMTGFKQHLRAAHEHAVQALRLLPDSKRLPREDVVLPLNGTLIIKHDGKIRILPVPKPAVEERVIQAFREKGVRVIPPSEVRELVRMHVREEAREEKRERREAYEERDVKPPVNPLPVETRIRAGMHAEDEDDLYASSSGEGEMDSEHAEARVQVNVSVQGSGMFP